MSDTPKTDAFIAGCQDWQDKHWVEFARELERDNSKLRSFVEECANDNYSRVSGGLKNKARDILK